MKRLFTFLVMLTVLTFSGVAYAESNIELFQEINEHLQIAIEEANIPGMAVSIVDKDSVLFSNTYGNCESIATNHGDDANTITAIFEATISYDGDVAYPLPEFVDQCEDMSGDKRKVTCVFNPGTR